MTDDELTIPDVLADDQKNFCSVFTCVDDEDEALDFNLSDSLYYTESEYLELIDSRKIRNSQNLTIISLNIANLLSKLRSLKVFVNNITTNENKPDLIIVVETHINKNINTGYSEPELKSILPGYEFFHQDRTNKRGGGVGIFIATELSSKAKIINQVKFTEEHFENIVMQIPGAISKTLNGQKKDLIIAAIYRQPNGSNFDEFNRELEKLLRLIDKGNNEIILAGDMNLDLLKYENHLPTANYLDLIISHKLLPRIVRPTRIKKQSATLIDHILTKEGNFFISGIMNTEIAGNSGYTDHLPIFTVLKANVQKNRNKQLVTKSFFTQSGNVERKGRLRREDWNDVYEQNDPNIIYDMIQQKYGFHYNETITTKTFKKGSNRHYREPWMNTEILADIRRRDRLAKQKHRRNDYKKLRNEIVSKIRKAEKQYLSQKISECFGNIKKHWNVIKKATNKMSNKEDTTTDFYYNGSMINDSQTNANNINSYYASIGPETNESVGKPKHDSHHYLQKHSVKNSNSLLLSDVTHEEVLEVCEKFTAKTSTDPNGFQQNIVLSDIGIIAPVLAHLVNCSQKTGIFPENGKIARVIPVYKLKGDKHLYENYRPISLLPIFSKIIERLIYNKVFDFLVRYEILFESQYGFRSGHNTTHATLDFIKSIEETIEQGHYAIGVFCDLSKAFDTLNHNILLSKLEHYGIRGRALDWFKSYLSNRYQYVELHGCKSFVLPLKTGVPQGSILGPLLFLLYINDLPAAANLKCVIFADDTNLLIKGNDLNKLEYELNQELEGINDYFKANQLKLNPKKTKTVIFRRKSLPSSQKQLEILLDGVKLSIDEAASFLGITIDSTLSWDHHCTNVANKISRSNSIINRVKKFLPPPTLKILYHSFIQPHLMYGLPAWGGCTAQNKKRIINIQKRAIRTITKSYFSAHTEPRMKQLGLLKFEDLYAQQCLVLTHDCYYKRAPKMIQNFCYNQHSSNYSLRGQAQNPLDLKISNFRSRAASNSYSANGPLLWNNHPNDLRIIQQKHLFKNKTKKHLLNSYEHKSNCTNPRCRDKSHHK